MPVAADAEDRPADLAQARASAGSPSDGDVVRPSHGWRLARGQYSRATALPRALAVGPRYTSSGGSRSARAEDPPCPRRSAGILRPAAASSSPGTTRSCGPPACRTRCGSSATARPRTVHRGHAPAAAPVRPTCKTRRAAVLALGLIGTMESNARRRGRPARRRPARPAVRRRRPVGGLVPRRHGRAEPAAPAGGPASPTRTRPGPRLDDLIRQAPDSPRRTTSGRSGSSSGASSPGRSTTARRSLRLNPYHFGAAAGLGQCFLKLEASPRAALRAFRQRARHQPRPRPPPRHHPRPRGGRSTAEDSSSRLMIVIDDCRSADSPHRRSLNRQSAIIDRRFPEAVLPLSLFADPGFRSSSASIVLAVAGSSGSGCWPATSPASSVGGQPPPRPAAGRRPPSSPGRS